GKVGLMWNDAEIKPPFTQQERWEEQQGYSPSSTAAVVAGQAVRVLAGPLGGRVQSPETYYTLLRRLPVLEIGVVLALSGLALLLIAGRAGGRTVAFGLVGAAA
ncbi:hypothetical protein CVH10_19215, partial [Halomonas sp. ND22Bw]|uniref:hypothetical protein n=1 Tax=Halomonas sp. ND22Bw TaxID=2054178 RepID=UPI000D28FBD4